LPWKACLSNAAITALFTCSRALASSLRNALRSVFAEIPPGSDADLLHRPGREKDTLLILTGTCAAEKRN
jgi:hypothetical protein